jgi:hypothetical protein
MKTTFLPQKIKYTGPQLSGLFSYEKLRVAEDSLITWAGPVEVREGLVDFEDLLNNDFIKADLMLHFILTVHGNDLASARLWQLLLVNIAFDTLRTYCTYTDGGYIKNKGIANMYRDGDDIFVVMEGTTTPLKMSVSIAALSPNQKQMVHLGINISDKGAPVKTSSLKKLGVEYEPFAREVMSRFSNEYDGLQKTLYKVAATVH